MTARTSRDRRRFRLAGNDNEIVVPSSARRAWDTDDDADVEGHRLAGNDNEIVVDGVKRGRAALTDEDPLGPSDVARR